MAWRMLRLALFILMASLASPAWAWPPTFGAEFNFRSYLDGVFQEHNYAVDQKAFRDVVQLSCPTCRIETRDPFVGRKIYIVHHPDGWNFTINLDPGVVEIQMSPSTVGQLKAREAEIQRLIFDVAHSLNLYSPERDGHIHVGYESAFENDPLLFRNYLVDRMLNSEMFRAAFGGSDRNSPSISQLGPEPLLFLRDVIHQFDAQVLHMTSSAPHFDILHAAQGVPQQLFAGVPRERAIQALINAINEHVYIKQPAGLPAVKFQAVNLWHDETLEDRSVPEAHSASHFRLIAEMIEGRIGLVKTFKGLIPFGEIPKPKDYREAGRLLKKYAEDAGISWERSQALLLLPTGGSLDEVFPHLAPLLCLDIFSR
jgi:hypothetical protein